MAYRSAVSYGGDSIVTVNGGSVTNIYFATGEVRAWTEKSQDTNPGNHVAIINAGELTKNVNIAVGTSLVNGYYTPATGKKFIAIVNNAESTYSATFGSNSAYLDYRIKTNNGKTTPVFERVDNDPLSSTLVGFTIESDVASDLIVPVVAGEKVATTGKTTADGKTIYDLSEYEDGDVITIEFVDERIPVVTTDETFTPDATIYQKVATISEAIDILGKDGGKLYIYGTFAPAKTEIEGTIENRGEVIIAGYGDSAAGGTFVVPQATYGSGMNGKWTKGDVKFENITMDAAVESGDYGSDVSISSGDYKVTFGEGIETGTYRINIAANTYKGNNVNVDIYSGKYQVISALTNGYFHSSGNYGPYDMNINVNIYGGDITYLYAISGSNYHGVDRTNYINGDITYNVNGGTIGDVNLIGCAYGSDVKVSGDTIFNINGGKINQNIKAQMGHTNLASATNYTTPERGNMAVVIDAANVEKAIIGYGFAQTSLDYFKMAENKYLIGIINNYDKANSNVRYNTNGYSDKAISDTNPCVLDRYDYKITVSGGVAQPYFVRTDADDPSTSYLNGFTIESNTAGLIPVVNGVAVPVVEGLTTDDGKVVYDLTAYKSDRADASDDAIITAITFVDPKALTVVYETVDNVSTYRTAGNYTAPTKNGYLFGGWYESETATVAMTEADVNAAAEAGTALYAKFVPAELLKVRYQLTAGTTSTSSDTNLRLIALVDSLQYKSVRFTLKATGNIDMTMDSNTVYSKIVAYDDNNIPVYEYDPTGFSDAAFRFMTHTVTGIPKEYFGEDLTVQASWLTKDGTRVYGAEATIVINDALNAQ